MKTSTTQPAPAATLPRQTERERQPDPEQRPGQHVVTLRPLEESVLARFCARYNLQPEIVVQTCAQYYLNDDTLDDRINREGLVTDVRAAQRKSRRGKEAA